MRILVCVAWPYAAGPRHLGHAVSTFIPADIVARYHRMIGDEVLMVGGTDMHGTPTMVLADEEGVAPSVIAERYHALHAKNIEQLGVNTTSTGTPRTRTTRSGSRKSSSPSRKKATSTKGRWSLPSASRTSGSSRTATSRASVLTVDSRGPEGTSARTAGGSSIRSN